VRYGNSRLSDLRETSTRAVDTMPGRCRPRAAGSPAAVVGDCASASPLQDELRVHGPSPAARRSRVLLQLSGVVGTAAGRLEVVAHKHLLRSNRVSRIACSKRR
jgi:hypothetical protein